MTKPLISTVNHLAVQQLNGEHVALLDPFNPHEGATRDLLKGIQGNILKAHGRHHTANLFIRCRQGQQVAVKTWLSELVQADEPLIRSAWVQLEENARFKRAELTQEQTSLFACVHISAVGYEYLLDKEAPLRFADVAFQNGMKLADLNDPPLARWEETYQKDVHLMLLLAHAEPTALTVALDAIQQQILPFAMITGIERGDAIFNTKGAGIEHFGYVDGISQPLFFDEEWRTYLAANNIKTQNDLRFDPRADVSLVLTADPFVEHDTNARGSYFVFRKLEQNVAGFKEAEEALARALTLDPADGERAGAMLIGRFEDGTPVEESAGEGMIGSADRNNFRYGVNDASRCPFHAHIRKSNPRFGAASQGNQPMLNHMMARRGITYGERDRPVDPQDKPPGGVGLLFMSYQASITNQFEFIQKQWVNNPALPHTHAATPDEQEGHDPIIGQGAPRANGAYATSWGNPLTLHRASFEPFVKLLGGEYFFAPSMSFLTNVSSL